MSVDGAAGLHDPAAPVEALREVARGEAITADRVMPWALGQPVVVTMPRSKTVRRGFISHVNLRDGAKVWPYGVTLHGDAVRELGPFGFEAHELSRA